MLDQITDEAWECYEHGAKANDYRTSLNAVRSHLGRLVEAGPAGEAALHALVERTQMLDAMGDRLSFAIYPAKVRFQLRRALFMATRDLSQLAPRSDLAWIESLIDPLGGYANGWELIADVPDDDRLELLSRWAALDWDGTLDTRDERAAAHTPAPIETRSWPELAAALVTTSYPRLVKGERDRKSVSRAIRCAPSVEEVRVLLDRMLASVTRWSLPVAAGLLPLAAVVAPAWLERGTALAGPRAELAYTLLRHRPPVELEAQLLCLPAVQLDQFVDRMRKERLKTYKQRATELAERRQQRAS